MPRLAPVNDGVILSLNGGEIKAACFLACTGGGQTKHLPPWETNTKRPNQGGWTRIGVQRLSLRDLGHFVGLRSLLALSDLKLDRVALL